MPGNGQNAAHSAAGAALGFYYQTFFALLTLLERDTDHATIAVEQLDDIVLNANGETLLFQLKHSISLNPSPITLKSRALWRTLKVWIDALPSLTLSETTFHLVTVADIPSGSPLTALTLGDADRNDLVKAMVEEARSVVDARIEAKSENKQIPYGDRVEGCEAFLALKEIERLNLFRRIRMMQQSAAIGDIEGLVATHLHILHPDHRSPVAKRLIEWWDRQVVYSLCGKRDRFISRAELQVQLSIIIADIEQGKLVPDFEALGVPEDYQPDGMLARQIRLVDGKSSDLSKAIREEWRAREQRSKWMNEKPSMATVIGDYDLVLREHWSDRHCQMVERCADVRPEEKSLGGLMLLRWTHDEAPNVVRPIAAEWNAPYYVRGSYQVLAINLEVGWHPDYAKLLQGDT